MDFTLKIEQLQKHLDSLGCRVLGSFIRGSRARGDGFEHSDVDLVAVVDRKLPFTNSTGFKLITFRDSQDNNRIQNHPVRPRDLRDARIIYDPEQDIFQLKKWALEALADPEKFRQRARMLHRLASISLENLRRNSVETSTCHATRLVLNTVRSILVRFSETPSGRRLLWQLSTVGGGETALFHYLTSTTLGLEVWSEGDAETFYTETLKWLVVSIDFSRFSEVGRFFSPERASYWQEGFYYLKTIDPVATTWIPLSLLQYPIQHCIENESPDLLRLARG